MRYKQYQEKMAAYKSTYDAWSKEQDEYQTKKKEWEQSQVQVQEVQITKVVEEVIDVDQ